MRRSELASLLVDLVGGSLLIHDTGSGWPALGVVQTDEGQIPVALFVGPIGLAHRPARIEVERRFQNPAASVAEQDLGGQGRPIEIPPGHLPLLIGVWIEDVHLSVPRPVLVLGDARKRAGLHSRYSVFQRVEALVNASHTGWAESVNQDGELMRYFDPRLLPAIALAETEQVAIAPGLIEVAVQAAGLADATDDEHALEVAGERARRTVTRLVRDARFSARVIGAYGARCAMCGLGLGLVQGAHIYPASAPDSSDHVRNGLCLCGNHHDAFDRHLVWVEPETLAVLLHPVVHASTEDPAVLAFIESTAPGLRGPDEPSAAPLADMFRRRYEYFEPRYGWVGQGGSQ